MRTKLRVEQGAKSWEWEGDLPPIPEGTSMSLSGATPLFKVRVQTIMILSDDSALQMLAGA